MNKQPPQQLASYYLLEIGVRQYILSKILFFTFLLAFIIPYLRNHYLSQNIQTYSFGFEEQTSTFSP